MTAVEYLSEQMRLTNIEGLRIKLWDAIEEAKEMEKEQIKDAYYKGGDDLTKMNFIESEQYYNETFKSE